MKWKRFLLAMGAGTILGYWLVQQKRSRPVPPEKVIQLAKNQYKDQMTITGSWIHVQPVNAEINGVYYDIYQGGLSGVQDGENRILDFKADADTGIILKAKA